MYDDVTVDTPGICNSRVYENQKDENASSSSGIGARTAIPVEEVPTLTSRSVWPHLAYARPWVFKETQLAKLQPLLLSSSPTVSSPMTGEGSESKTESPAAAKPEISQ